MPKIIATIDTFQLNQFVRKEPRAGESPNGYYARISATDSTGDALSIMVWDEHAVALQAELGARCLPSRLISDMRFVVEMQGEFRHKDVRRGDVSVRETTFHSSAEHAPVVVSAEQQLERTRMAAHTAGFTAQRFAGQGNPEAALKSLQSFVSLMSLGAPQPELATPTPAVQAEQAGVEPAIAQRDQLQAGLARLLQAMGMIDEASSRTASIAQLLSSVDEVAMLSGLTKTPAIAAQDSAQASTHSMPSTPLENGPEDKASPLAQAVLEPVAEPVVAAQQPAMVANTQANEPEPVAIVQQDQAAHGEQDAITQSAPAHQAVEQPVDESEPAQAEPVVQPEIVQPLPAATAPLQSPQVAQPAQAPAAGSRRRSSMSVKVLGDDQPVGEQSVGEQSVEDAPLAQPLQSDTAVLPHAVMSASLPMESPEASAARLFANNAPAGAPRLDAVKPAQPAPALTSDTTEPAADDSQAGLADAGSPLGASAEESSGQVAQPAPAGRRASTLPSNSAQPRTAPPRLPTGPGAQPLRMAATPAVPGAVPVAPRPAAPAGIPRAAGFVVRPAQPPAPGAARVIPSAAPIKPGIPAAPGNRFSGFGASRR